MRINLFIVRHRVSGLDVIAESLGDPYRFGLRSCAIWDGEGEASAEVLYICERGKPLPESDARLSVIAMGDEGDEVNGERYDYVLAGSEMEALELQAEVLELFCELSDWDDRMRDAALGANPIAGQMKVAQEQFGNDLTLYDAQNFMIRHSDGPGSEMGGYYPEGDEGYVAEEHLEQVLADPRWREVSESEVPLVFPAGVYPVDSLNCNIFSGDTVIARLMVDATARKLSPEDAPLAFHAAERMRPLVLDRIAQPPSPQIESLFKDVVLEGRALRQDHVAALAKMGWDAEGAYRVLVVEPALGPLDRSVVAQVAQSLSQHLADSLCFDAGDRLIVVMRETWPSPGPFGDISLGGDFSRFLKRNSFACGASGVFRGMGGASTAYRKARMAVDFGRVAEPGELAHFFERLATGILLRNAPGGLPALEYCTEPLRRLAEYDRENGADLLVTLRALVRSGMSATAAAQRLFVHKTTFYYRLRRIAEVGGIDPYEERTRLYLTLMFELVSIDELRSA